MDRQGPRVVIPVGVLAMSAGLALAPFVSRPWHLYLTLGVLVSCGSVVVGYTGHSFFLPNWFVRRRGIALGMAFSGVGVGAVVLFPWLQAMIVGAGWRTACWAMAALLLVLVPLNALFQRLRPEDMRLAPDGESARRRGGDGPPCRQCGRRRVGGGGVDARARVTDATILVAIRRLLHQSLRLVRGASPPDQVPHRGGLRARRRCVCARLRGSRRRRRANRPRPPLRPDRAGVGVDDLVRRVCHLLRDPPPHAPGCDPGALVCDGSLSGRARLWHVVGVRRHPRRALPGQALRLGLRRAEPGASAGAGTGPWVTGVLYDRTGSYVLAFWLAIVFSIASAVCIWLAAPRKVRAVAGRIPAR